MTNEDQTDLTAGKDIPPWLQPIPEGEDEAIEAAARRRKLIITSGAAVGVIGLFTAVILYLYDGADPIAPRHVAAPTEPVRERPNEVGGMQVAHQDKEVFNQVDGSEHRSDVQLGAQPEEPLAELPKDPPLESSNEVEDAIAQVIASAETSPEPTKSMPAETKPAVEKLVEAPVTKPEPVSDEEVYRIQLGAYGSEDSAGRAWRLVKGKFAAHLSGKTPSYEAVQSGSRTLYRLRVGPLETRAEADQVCLALRAGQQACIVVNP